VGAVTRTEALSISDAGVATGLSPHTLRYGERAGLIDRVGRADSTHRRYTEAEINWVIFLTKLRATGKPIRTTRQYADLVRAGDGNEAGRLALLEAYRADGRARLQEVSRNLKAIETKIDLYHERIAT
jgi:DNA-binding transcriptional MerR regulator